MKRRISILGSTGSIGRQTLEVIRCFPEKFEVTALCARKNIELLLQQVNEFKPKLVALTDEKAANQLAEVLGNHPTKVACGETGLFQVATHSDTDILVGAIVGFSGLKPILAAIDVGIDIALANKETLVVAGDIVTRRAREKGVQIIPVDSEHSAIFQCLQGNGIKQLERIILTASGGPFYRCTLSEMNEISPVQALQHPNWTMGAKITIDSATLMNKGLEVLEAHWLFEVPLSRIAVIIHPQSLVHSLVEFQDGSLLGQFGPPDMRLPILYALSHPERWPNKFSRLNLIDQKLTFIAPDTNRFPCLTYAYEAGEKGGTMPAVLNAANEAAVAAFLCGKVGFLCIPKIVKTVMDRHDIIFDPDIDDIEKADIWGRQEARRFIESLN